MNTAVARCNPSLPPVSCLVPLNLRINSHLPPPPNALKSKRLLGCKAHLVVELDGQENSVRHEIAAVEKIIRKQKPLFDERGFGNEQCEAVWQIRREFSYALRDTGLTKLNEDIVVPRGPAGRFV